MTSLKIAAPVASGNSEIVVHKESPENKLLRALLSRAILDLAPGNASEDRKSAIQWFRHKWPKGKPRSFEEYFMSFQYIVEQLELTSKSLLRIEKTIKDAEALEEIRCKVEREIKNNRALSEEQRSRTRIRQRVREEWRKFCDKEIKAFGFVRTCFDDMENARMFRMVMSL